MSQVLHGDCLEILPTLPDASADMILTDPPYYRVKSETWDRQWENPERFLSWLEGIAVQWRRILKPNGSLYVFVSPQMAARVEVMLGQYFHILNQIRWQKRLHTSWRMSRDAQRMYLSPWEGIIFAEHYGADSMALGESGYAAQCEKLHGFVFEPLRAYLDGERRRAGISHRMVIAHLSMTGHDSHFFSPIQWKLPLPDQYNAMRDLFTTQGKATATPYLTRSYDDLRRQYDDLRRPFQVTEHVPYTDVWDFPTVPPRPGKHVCEKPQTLLQHIITTSTRPGALVLDCFAGSGSTGAACQRTGRDYLIIEREARYLPLIASTLAKHEAPTQPALLETAA